MVRWELITVSFKMMLAHRAKLWRMTEVKLPDGSVYEEWAVVPLTPPATDIKCYADLNFIRKGKDQMWVAEVGRPADRTGVIFMPGNAPIKSGDRIEITVGPIGTFEIQSAVDEAWRPRAKHHLELGVIEISSMLTRGYSQP